MIEVRRFADANVLALAATEFFIEQAESAIADRGGFYVTLSGGSTPKAMNRILAEQFADRIDWSKVFVFWGDERCVPPDDDDSNFKMAKATLLDHVGILDGNTYRIHAELPPEEAASRYEGELKQVFPGVNWPGFDLIFLGLGTDGHTASLFPYTAALHEQNHWVVANYVEKLDTWRITLTAPAINAASNVVFLVAGEPKAEPLREVINGEYQPEQYPSQLIKPHLGKLFWFVDEAAAVLI